MKPSSQARWWLPAAAVAIAFSIFAASWAAVPAESQNISTDAVDAMPWEPLDVDTVCDDACAARVSDLCDCADSSTPRWIVQGGAVILHRSSPSNLTLFSDATTGAELVNARSYDFGWSAGPDIAVWRRLNPSDYLEVRFFDVASFTAAQGFDSSGPVVVNTAPPVSTPGATSISTAYGSSLYSTEINFRRRFSPWGTWLAGFRTLQVRDDFNVYAALPIIGVNAHFETNAHNFLYGAQTGLALDVWNRGPLQLQGLCKAGLYGNAANQATTDLVSVGGSPSFLALGAWGRGSQAAFVGEIGLTAVWQWTDRIYLRGGYQLLWIDGLALATNQFPSLNLATQSGLSTGGGVFYHGALTGLEFRF